MGLDILAFVVPIILILVVVVIFLSFVPLGLWISAISAGVKVSIFSLVGMRLRRVRADKIIRPLIKAQKAGMNVNANQLESHLLSGGRVDNVVDALIAAHRANLDLSFERAAAIDLAGRNVFEAVRMSVTPKIIETPWISAVAIDGIEVKVIAKVTVRANLARLVGGAGEETIIARVGEGIVTTVGSSQSHKSVLENPDLISRTVLAKGLDSGDMLLKAEVEITDEDTFATIHDKMAVTGANLLLDTLDQLEAGTLERIPQDHDAATYVPMITKETGHIDWSKNRQDIINLIRGLNPVPAAYTIYEEEVLKIFGASLSDVQANSAANGEIVAVVKKGFVVKCGDGCLLITEVQARGGKRMMTDAYLRGHAMKEGILLQ